MEYFGLMIFAMFLVAAAFQAGQWSKEYPSEEEMIRRIVQSRIEKRLQERIEAEVADEINRQAAG